MSFSPLLHIVTKQLLFPTLLVLSILISYLSWDSYKIDNIILNWWIVRQSDSVDGYISYASVIRKPFMKDQALDRVQFLYTQKWEAAKESESPHASLLYARYYPQSPFLDDALIRGKDLEAWASACRQDTPEAYADYLKQYPNGLLTEKAQAQFEETNWRLCLAARSEKALEDFRSRFPGNPYVSDIPRLLDSLRWEAALAEKCAEALTDFASSYPESIHCAEVPVELMELAWRQALSDGTPKSYEAFVEQYPESPYKEQATEILWQHAISEGTIPAFMRFQTFCPDSPYVSEVPHRIAKRKGELAAARARDAIRDYRLGTALSIRQITLWSPPGVRGRILVWSEPGGATPGNVVVRRVEAGAKMLVEKVSCSDYSDPTTLIYFYGRFLDTATRGWVTNIYSKEAAGLTY